MRNLICLTSLLYSALSMAQDPYFSQPQSGQTYTNPAFTGNDTIGTFFMAYRNQWPELESNSQTFIAGCNQYLSSLNSYFGVHYINDAAGAIKEQKFSLVYAQNIPLSKKRKNIFLRPALEAGYFEKKLDWSNLSFGDMIDPRKGWEYSTNDVPRGGKVSNIDFAAGIMFYWNRFSAGVSAHHLNKPNEALMTGNSPKVIRYGLQMGYDYNLPLRNMMLSPWISLTTYRIMLNQVQAGYGLNYKISSLRLNYYFGIAGRIQDAFIILAGMEFNKIKLMYSYDINTGGLQQKYTGGSHEISMRMNIWKVKAHEKWRAGSSVFI